MSLPYVGVDRFTDVFPYPIWCLEMALVARVAVSGNPGRWSPVSRGVVVGEAGW